MYAYLDTMTTVRHTLLVPMIPGIGEVRFTKRNVPIVRVTRRALVAFFFIELTDDLPNKICPPSGAITLHDTCSMEVDGGTFVHNAASNDGGIALVSE